MAYTKTTWQDRVVQNPNTYNFQNNADGTTTLLPAEGTITTAGTIINASALNNLETQYDDAVAWAKSFGLGDVAEDVSNTNINSIDATGFYKGLNMPSAPTGDSYFIINIKYDANNRFQQVHQSTNGNGVWRRFQNAGTWGSWDSVISASMLPSSLGGSGWQKLPSGLMIQWGGSGGSNVTNGQLVNFPVSFPQSCVVVTPVAYSGYVESVGIGSSPTKSGFNVYVGGSCPILYIAIGY